MEVNGGEEVEYGEAQEVVVALVRGIEEVVVGPEVATEMTTAAVLEVVDTKLVVEEATEVEVVATEVEGGEEVECGEAQELVAALVVVATKMFHNLIPQQVYLPAKMAQIVNGLRRVFVVS